MITKTNLPCIDCPEGCFIIDTGSPKSFGQVFVVTVGGKQYKLGDDPIISDLQKNLGSHIKGLVGMDILSNYNLYIRFNKQKNQFQVDLLYDSSKEDIIIYRELLIEVVFFTGVPVISAIVNEKKSRFFLDSASTISYIRDSIVDKKRKCGSKKDFYPLFGSFITDIYKTQINVSGIEYKLEVGLLPDMLKGLLPKGIAGILGADFIRMAPLLLGFKSKKYKLLTGNGGNGSER